jgi:uncharacterized protein YutE (UPF0331/DUF86 family)
MKSLVIEEKAESLRRCLSRIESKKPFTREELFSNWDLQDILSLNLERAVQMAVDIGTLVIAEIDISIPSTMAETFDILYSKKIISETTKAQLKKAVGYRNLAIHEYDKVDWNIVFAITHQHLEDFRNFLKQIFEWMEAS